jgi:hypothetical protein
MVALVYHNLDLLYESAMQYFLKITNLKHAHKQAKTSTYVRVFQVLQYNLCLWLTGCWRCCQAVIMLGVAGQNLTTTLTL